MIEVDCGSGRRWFEGIVWEVRCLACYSTMKFSFSELNWVSDEGRITLYIYCPCCGNLHVSYQDDPSPSLSGGSKSFRELRRSGDSVSWGITDIWINDADRKAFTVAFPERGRSR